MNAIPAQPMPIVTPSEAGPAGRRRRRGWAALLAAIASVAGLSMSAAPAAAVPVHPAARSANASLASPGAGTTARTAQPKAAGKVQTVNVCPPAKAGYDTCFSERRTDVAAHKGLFAAATTPAGYGPSDLQSAYNLGQAAASGSGETVAIVDAFDDPTAEADLQIYRAQYGLPACTTANGCFSKVAQDGSTNYPPTDPSGGWEEEESLDVDMVSAICPDCHVLLVEANDNSDANLGAAVDEAVALGAKYVSNSYGGPEDSSELSADTQYYNHPGVAVTASTGDSGFGVEYPAASQYVTAVGGTTLTRDSAVPRGWTETAWGNGQSGTNGDGAGSGCSAVEPKPAWQTDTGCTNRTVADVSADADPATGVAVYDTFGTGGWTVLGGTSVASPIIASTYALAGSPDAGSYPSSYPYADTTALNDVTSGTNGGCSPLYLCNAGPGYDGPTGLGTPNGVSAFTTGPHGDITGTVTDASTGKPIAGAVISAGGVSTMTDTSGHYDLVLPPGGYDVSFRAFGYTDTTATGVQVINGATDAQNAALSPVPSAHVTGTVTDGSGHGWPLHASIAIDGRPGGPVWTDPATGQYSVDLPENATYTLTVIADLPGYQVTNDSITVGSSDLTHDISVLVDAATCTAPGYHFESGTPALSENFDDYPGDGGTTPPPGWTIVDNEGNGKVWSFSTPGFPGNLTGGTGNFAIVNSDGLGFATEDTSLVSPVLDLSGEATPVLTFHNDYFGFSQQSASVDLSTDGGQTWTTIWEHTNGSVRGPDLEDVPVPQAGGNSDVQLRFHFIGTFGLWWEVDDITVQNRSCSPVPGGLVVGKVTDANTGSGLNGATVTSTDNTSDKAVAAASADPAMGSGYYWLFSSLTGSHQFTAAKRSATGASGYQPASQVATVTADGVARSDISLKAGRLSITPGSIQTSQLLGTTASATMTIKNTGSAPANVQLVQQGAQFQVLTAHGAPLQRIRLSEDDPAGAAASFGGGTPGVNAGAPADSTWSTIAPYPTSIADNSAAVIDGKVYSVGGSNGTTLRTGYSYDSLQDTWTPIAPMPLARQQAGVAAVSGKLYVTAGWDSTGTPIAETDVYDPAGNTWSTLSPDPNPTAAAGVAVAGGKIYLVGGCKDSTCTSSSAVEVYDPASDAWSTAASYPQVDAFLSCGGIDGKVYCAGGTAGGTAGKTYSNGFVYDPSANTWSPIASLPIDLWGSAYGAPNGLLVVSSGLTADNSVITNQGYAYDPTTDSWTALPNAQFPRFRMGSACGFYKIGGSAGGSSTQDSEALAGLTECGTASIPWLTESTTTATLQPGDSTTVTLTLSATTSDTVTQPGADTGQIGFDQDTPYTVSPVDVTMDVTPPKGWGKISGTLAGENCSQVTAPMRGVVFADGKKDYSFTLPTGNDGSYAFWAPSGAGPFSMTASANGWIPQTITADVKSGKSGTVDFTLRPTTC